MAKITYTNYKGNPLATALSALGNLLIGAGVMFLVVGIISMFEDFDISLLLIWIVMCVFFVGIGFGLDKLSAIVATKKMQKTAAKKSNTTVESKPQSQSRPEPPTVIITPPPAPVQKEEPSSMEAQLKQFKALYEEGLISEEEYNEKRRQIIGL